MISDKHVIGKCIARHLWRMCFGLFIAAGSFFLGPSNRPLRLLSDVGIGQHVPSVLFSTGLYLFLSMLPLILLIFWLLRVRFANAFKGKPTAVFSHYRCSQNAQLGLSRLVATAPQLPTPGSGATGNLRRENCTCPVTAFIGTLTERVIAVATPKS